MSLPGSPAGTQDAWENLAVRGALAPTGRSHWVTWQSWLTQRQRQAGREPLRSCVSRSLARSLAHRTHSNAKQAGKRVNVPECQRASRSSGRREGSYSSTAGLSTAWFKEPAGAWEAAGRAKGNTHRERSMHPAGGWGARRSAAGPRSTPPPIFPGAGSLFKFYLFKMSPLYPTWGLNSCPREYVACASN